MLIQRLPSQTIALFTSQADVSSRRLLVCAGFLYASVNDNGVAFNGIVSPVVTAGGLYGLNVKLLGPQEILGPKEMTH